MQCLFCVDTRVVATVPKLSYQLQYTLTTKAFEAAADGEAPLPCTKIYPSKKDTEYSILVLNDSLFPIPPFLFPVLPPLPFFSFFSFLLWWINVRAEAPVNPLAMSAVYGTMSAVRGTMSDVCAEQKWLTCGSIRICEDTALLSSRSSKCFRPYPSAKRLYEPQC